MSIPAYDPQSCWLKGFYHVVNALASLTAVQTLLGAADASEAKAGNMFLHTTGEVEAGDNSIPLPSVVIGIPESAMADASRPATSREFFTSQCEVQFHKAVDKSKAMDIEQIEWQDQVGLIVEQLAAAHGILDTSAITIQSHGRIVKEGDITGHHFAIIRLNIGTSSGTDK